MSDFSTTFREYASFGKSAIGTVLPLILIGSDGSKAPSFAEVRSIEKPNRDFLNFLVCQIDCSFVVASFEGFGNPYVTNMTESC